MLCLTLKSNQEFTVGEAKIIVVKKGGSYFRAYIEAPPHWDISRGELKPPPRVEHLNKRERKGEVK